MSKFNICNCFYTENYFVESIRCHLRYIDDEQFQREYAEIPQKYGVSMAVLLAEVNEEKRRRRDVIEGSAERRLLIQRNYTPLRQEIFELKEEYFDNQFLSLWRNVCNGDKKALVQYKVEHERYGLFQFPIFTVGFCRFLIEELANFQSKNLPRLRPNTMNHHGVLLDEIGFTNFFDTLREKYLSPLAAHVYPEWTGERLDSHRAFTVTYKTETPTDPNHQPQSALALHYDNAEVTLNVSLNDDYEGGEIYFNGMKMGSNSIQGNEKEAMIKHKLGWGILHRARQLHSATAIEKGCRHNLIVWMRSSLIRNRICPMCWQEPKLIPVMDGGGYGDGFTKI